MPMTREEATPILMLTWPDVMNSDPMYGSMLLYHAEQLCRQRATFSGHTLVMLEFRHKLVRPAGISDRAVADLGIVLESIGWIERAEPPRRGVASQWRSLFPLG